MNDQAGKKNIFHVVQFLEIGGLESLVLTMCDHANHGKYSFNVLCLRGYDPKYQRRIESMGASVFLIEKKNISNFKYVSKIVKLLREQKANIIHVHSGCFFYGMLAGLLAQVPGRLYTSHGMTIQKSLQVWLEDYLAAMISNQIVAVSAEINSHLVRRFPGQKEKIRTIINGIDTDKFVPGNAEQIRAIKEKLKLPVDCKIIGSVGRLEPVKNYPMLLRSFSRTLQTHTGRLHLVLIGSGSEQHKLENLAEELSISGQVSFLGVQYDIHTILPALDIFVLCSLSEGTSISLLESQACGIPAVVTDVGGNGKIVKHGENGYLCRIDDDQNMAFMLSKLLHDDDLAHRMEQSARQRVVGNYAITTMVKAYENLYDSLTG